MSTLERFTIAIFGLVAELYGHSLSVNKISHFIKIENAIKICIEFVLPTSYSVADLNTP